jgi:hypothetical protein
MTSNKQHWAVEVQLEKAKRAINFLFVLSLIAVFGVYSSIGFENLTFIQITISIILFIASRIIYEQPIFAVVVLAIVVLFYMYGWVLFLFDSPDSFGIDASNMIGIAIIFYRFFITGVAIGGLYFAIKGLNGKEHFEKNHGTLDEDEM